MRAVMNGVMDILSTGCQWRSIPKDFPLRSTSHDYFTRWHFDGTLDGCFIHHVGCCEKAERATGCIIDNQSVIELCKKNLCRDPVAFPCRRSQGKLRTCSS
jgi:transposase